MSRGEMKPIRAKNGHREKPAHCHHFVVHRMSCEQYELLKARAAGCCEICGISETTQYRQMLGVDHCHSTGRIRGLLCSSCNRVMACVDGVKPWGENRRWESVAMVYRDRPEPWGDLTPAPVSKVRLHS